MPDNLEKLIIEEPTNNVNVNINSKSEDSWIKKSFKEEWPTMGNHLVACASAIGLATGFSYYSKELIDSDAAISGIATVLDMAGYWGVFIPQLMYRDRNKLKNENGELDMKKVGKKAGEYLGYIGVIEGIYSCTRFLTQYFMQKNGIDPATASASIQVGATAFFTLAFPPIRYAVKQWSEKE
ncbi:MAG: hypothetical protein WC867_03540 [Candidatus Pacearchaeota archaeon]|jgi:hypothetical protein